MSTGSPTEAIVFSSGANTITRADYTGATAATKLGANFVVEGVKWNGTGGGSDPKVTVFDHYNVNFEEGTANTTTSNTAGWEYVAQTKHADASISAQTIKYWDYAKSQYDFIAYSKGLLNPEAEPAQVVYESTSYNSNNNIYITPITPATMGTADPGNASGNYGGAYSVSGKAENLAKFYIADLITAYNPADYQKTVKFEFRSLSAKVRVALYEIVPGYSVKNVKFYTNSTTVSNDDNLAHLYTTGGGSNVFNEIGTYTVYYPTTGSSNVGKTDYNKAHLAFTPAASDGTSTVKNFGAFVASSETATLNNTFAAAEDHEAAGNYLGRSSNDATYAGVNTTSNPNYYTTVIPNEAGAVLNLKVNYTLVSTDGSGEEINVTGATAVVPAVYASWKSGYAYTYLFKISHNSNGQTGTGDTPEGLYPITFDAVVTETEEHIQETITTVATPSITTYTKGKVVTSNNEYTIGNNIYIVVDDPSDMADDVLELLTSGNNVNALLYTVTISDEDAAAQTINESTVANALLHGTGPAGTWTVRDINGETLTVSAVSGLTSEDEIAAEDAPDGNAIAVDCAKFTPAASGYYVFQYRPIVTEAELYTAEDETANPEHVAGTVKTPAVYKPANECYYKIIKVDD